MGSQQTVLVIGGGISGLAAALELSKNGWQVTILEARRRLGGRVLSRKSHGMDVELGAEFIHGRNEALWNLIESAELKTAEVPDQHWIPKAPGKLEKEDVWSEIEKIFGRMDTRQPDQTFADFIAAQSIPMQLRELAIDFVEGFNAADHRVIGVHGLAAAEESSEKIEGDRSFRIAGGYGLLVDFLESQLSRANIRLVPNAIVKRIVWRPHNARAEVSVDGRKQEFTGSVAVITLPVGVLKLGSVRFEPSLPEKEELVQEFHFGNVTKVVLKFRSPFWAEPNFGFIHSQDEWLPTWWSHEDEHTIVGWAGGPKGARLTVRDDRFIQQRALEGLTRIFDDQTIPSLLMEFHHHNWKSDPFARGAYSYLPVNGLDLPRALGACVEDTLFFAGEATTIDYQLGTVHGALESGLRAAHEVCSMAFGNAAGAADFASTFDPPVGTGR
jgi:monoamine oxidase